MVKRKARALTRSTKQTGTSNMKRDLKRKALAPGKRRSKSGTIYYENRKNRSDVKGRDTPKKVKKATKKIVKKKPIMWSSGKKKFVLSPRQKEQLLTQYKKNEARNYHTENAIMLIKLFGTPAQLKKAMQIKKNRDKKGLTSTESAWLYKNGHSHYKKLVPTARPKKPKTVRSTLRKSVVIGVTPNKRKMMIKDVTKEPNQGMRRHKLMPLALRNKIPKLYATDGKKDKKVWVKFFSPYSQYTLYVVEFDGKDTVFGYVTGMGSNEWGYSSLSELARANRRGLPLIERDIYFTPKMFSKVRK